MDGMDGCRRSFMYLLDCGMAVVRCFLPLVSHPSILSSLPPPLRLSTVEKADIIFVLEEGRIVEKGSFRDLLSRKDGAFGRLHQSASFLSFQNGGRGLTG